ncbi:WD40 repeat domain-containing protein [Zobellella sp. DQSA1]|uniref:WD40 repeat domain-containing protein n=1 Tax=Zobellella sp. DQSA1 TaxID=3342386 RepID=UPI0035BFDB98
MPIRLLTTALCVTLLLLTGCDAGDTPLQQSRYAEGTVLAAETSADGRHTLVSTGPGPVQVWRHGDPEPLYHWYQDESLQDIVLLAISPDGRAAATASEDRVALWSLETGRNLGFYQLNHTLRTLALADEGRSLLLGYQSGEAEHVNLSNGRRLLFLGHEDRINSLDLSANGRYALSASHDGQVILWQTTDAAILARWQHPHSVSLVRLDQDGGYAFSADAQGSGIIRRLPSGEPVASLQVPHRGQTFVSARLDPANNRLLTGGTARRLDLWQMDSGQLLGSWRVGLHTRLRPASAMVYGVAFIDRQRLYSISSAGLGETWALPQREQQP